MNASGRTKSLLETRSRSVPLPDRGSTPRKGYERLGRGVTAALAAIALNGCGYFQSRGDDFLDIWVADTAFAGASPGVELELTDLFHTGLGGGIFMDRTGMHGRRFQVSKYSDCGGALLVFRDRSPLKGGPRRGGWLWNFVFLGDYFRDDGKRWSKTCAFTYPKVPWIGLLDLEIEAYFFLDLRFGVRPGQMLDFVVGWFGLDPAEDDPSPNDEDADRTDASDSEEDPPFLEEP